LKRPVPAKAIIVLRSMTISDVARAYGCSAHYAGRVLNGIEKPSAGFRAFLADYLDLPDDVLWHDDPVTAGDAA
jgi:transcriptional regulator with XRE-family HTH domain